MKKIIKIFSMVFILCILVGCGKTNDTTDTKKEQEKEVDDKIFASNLGTFIEYNDELYYWKLTKESRQDDEVFLNYNEIYNHENDLIKINKDGKEEIFYSGKGGKELVIVNDVIYTSYSVDEYENSRQIYSINMKDKSINEIGKGKIKYIIDGYIYGEIDRFKGGIFYIDTNTGKYNVINDTAIIYAVNKDKIYYYDNSNRNSQKIIIGTIQNGKDIGELFQVKYSDFSSYATTLEIEKVNFYEDKIEFLVGFRDGTANSIQEINKYTLNNENELKKEKYDISEKDYFDLTDSLVYTNTKEIVYNLNNNVKKIISYKDIESKYKLVKNDETSFNVYASNLIKDEIYFILDYGKHDSKKDIGWRYSYKRNKTIFFKYNISTSELKVMYEF